MHKLTGVMLAAALLLAGCSANEVAAPATSSAEDSAAVGDRAVVSVADAEVGDLAANGWAVYRYPVFEVDYRDSAIADRIEAALNDYVAGVIEVYPFDGPANDKFWKAGDDGWTFDFTADSVFSDRGLLSVSFNMYHYATGFTTDFTRNSARTFDLETGEEIKLADQFTKEGRIDLAKGVFDDIAWLYGEDRMLYSRKRGVKILSDPAVYNGGLVSYRGLEVFLGKYTITTGNAGAPSDMADWRWLDLLLTADSPLRRMIP